MTAFYDEIPLYRWQRSAGADRVLLVNTSGTGFSNDNPMPVSLASGSVSIVIGEVKIKETIPTDSSKNNPSFFLDYDGRGNISIVQNTINGVVYQKSLSYNAAGDLISGTKWAQI